MEPFNRTPGPQEARAGLRGDGAGGPEGGDGTGSDDLPKTSPGAEVIVIFDTL